MEAEAYAQYQRESQNWLKSGRRDLLERMLASTSDGRRDLHLLEVGAGVGQNVPTLHKFGEVDVVEMNTIGLQALRKTPGIRWIYDTPIPFACNDTYDAIVAMDVIEHIADDRGALEWIAARLKARGTFFCTVPAYQWLYSEHDEALHHLRRYSRQHFREVLPASLAVMRCGYFNSILFPIAASLRLAAGLKTAVAADPKRAARKQSSAVPRIVNPLLRGILRGEAKVIGQGFDFPFGLSVYCLARRRE
jgi:SAM-dependent methyltransferase